jgi:hypothetical protein
MSITTGMSKTPGARQHNRGWMKMLREERRKEAQERADAYLLKHITSDPGIVTALNAAEDAKLRGTRPGWRDRPGGYLDLQPAWYCGGLCRGDPRTGIR